MRRITRLRRRFKLVRNVLQVLAKRAHDLMVAIASHHYLIVGSRADDQVRQLKALILQTQADERISFAEDFSDDGGGVLLGHAAI
jgi:hypothetical protein